MKNKQKSRRHLKCGVQTLKTPMRKQFRFCQLENSEKIGRTGGENVGKIWWKIFSFAILFRSGFKLKRFHCKVISFWPSICFSHELRGRKHPQKMNRTEVADSAMSGDLESLVQDGRFWTTSSWLVFTNGPEALTQVGWNFWMALLLVKQVSHNFTRKKKKQNNNMIPRNAWLGQDLQSEYRTSLDLHSIGQAWFFAHSRAENSSINSNCLEAWALYKLL